MLLCTYQLKIEYDEENFKFTSGILSKNFILLRFFYVN